MSNFAYTALNAVDSINVLHYCKHCYLFNRYNKWTQNKILHNVFIKYPTHPSYNLLKYSITQ